MSSKKVSLRTTVAGIPFETCIYNASGPRTGSSAALGKIAQSESGGVLAKSATVLKQDGNPLPRTWHQSQDHNTSRASLNSEGLPNAGIDYYISTLTIDEAMEGFPEKPYMVSISGKNLEDNLAMLDRIATSEASAKIAAVELNLACPNVIGKPIIAYDFVQMDSVLKEVRKLMQKKKISIPLGVKLPPYMDGPHFEQAASVVNKYKDIVKYVCSINTIGNAFAVDVDAEMPVISSKGGFAGLSGPAVKYTALANVKRLRELLDADIDVVGAGGVQTGADAFELLLCGASAVQVGTCHWTEGPGCFDRICTELRDLMASKGYTRLEDVKGKLKPWSKEGAAISRAARKKQSSPQSTTTTFKTEPKQGREIMITFALLVGIIGVLLADKFGIVSI
eukprot:scaffold74722_cov48-Attheya_sp.AAC.2